MPSQIRAGDLNRLISIQIRRETKDELNQPVNTWEDLKRVYASINPLSGNKLLAGRAINVEVTHEIAVRYDPIFADPRKVGTYRALYRGRIFTIHAPMNDNERDRLIRLHCSEGANNG